VAATFLVVPQWQGSGSSRAMRLVDGAEAILADLPGASTISIDVPLGAGNDEGTLVHRLSAIQSVRDAQLAALQGIRGLAVTIGGDCGVELAAIQHAAAANDGMAVVWLGAHPDLHTPESSPSRAFHGMVLRTLLGDGDSSLTPAKPLEAGRLILAGTRALDDAEASFVDSAGLRIIAPEGLTPAAIGGALSATGATSVYLHVDLDVLDPAEFDGLGFPEPFGVTLAALLETIAAVKATLPLVGAGLTEFAPSSAEAAADDLGSILRIIGAISSS
jgi:arginase